MKSGLLFSSKKFNHTNEFEFPVIPKVTLESGSRYYEVDGEKYPSITTLLSTHNKEGLDNWKKRVGKENAERIAKVFSKRGSSMHEIIERYLNNESNVFKDSLLSEQMLFKQCKKFLDKIDNIECQEAMLYSKALKIAGTTDCIAEYDGELSVIDFKNSRKEKSREWITSYFYQTAFYAICFYEKTGKLPRQLVIIIADANGGASIFIEKTETWLKKTYNLVKHLRVEYMLDNPFEK